MADNEENNEQAPQKPTENEEVKTENTEETKTEEVAQDDGELVVSIGDEESPPQEEAPEWVKDLRKSHRDTQKENRELKKKLESTEQKKTVTLPPKPELESFDYDTEKYGKSLDEWYEIKRKVDDESRKVEQDAKSQTDQWNNTLTSYGKAKDDLGAKDYEEAEDVVQATLSETQQGMILQGASNPALLVYALGKNPKKADDLASIKDPVKFAFAVGRMESQLKVNKRTPPPPEKAITGTANSSGTVDSTLEKLREEAAKTGDMTKVHAYKKKQKAS